MKLKELLEVIPDEFEIGLTSYDEWVCTFVYGKKDDAILSFAIKKKFIKEQVENMDVMSIHPCAYVQCLGQNVYNGDELPFHINPQLLIELKDI
jgi:hypothetical protein